MSPQALQVQEKQELEGTKERTESGRYYLPYTDIHETADAIVVTMEMPGVDRERVDITLENDVLSVAGRVDLSKYDGLEPVYTEYNVGNYSRSSTVSSEIDREKISANVSDGVSNCNCPRSNRRRRDAFRSNDGRAFASRGRCGRHVCRDAHPTFRVISASLAGKSASLASFLDPRQRRRPSGRLRHDELEVVLRDTAVGTEPVAPDLRERRAGCDGVLGHADGG